MYTVKDHTKWYNDRTKEEGLVEYYNDMKQIAHDSARQHLYGLGGIVHTTGEVNDIRDAFREHFFEIYELWLTHDTNILYIDLDVVIQQPTEIFGLFDKFTMFNYTDPRSNYNHDHYFNCGVRYYPKDMDHSVWDIGLKQFENMDKSTWDEEQRIYNDMMWSQSDNINYFLHPEFAYQRLSENTFSNNVWNGFDIEDAKIVHVHGSRGAKRRSHIMKQLFV